MLENRPAFSGYSVNNLEEAKKFYVEILGIKGSDDWMGLHLEFSNGQQVFIYEKVDHKPATFTVLNIVVENIDQTIDAIKEKGIMFERYDNLPADQDERGVLRGKDAGMGPDIAWFKDPSGNILALIEN